MVSDDRWLWSNLFIIMHTRDAHILSQIIGVISN